MEETSNGLVPITPEVKHALQEWQYKTDDKCFLTVAIDFDGTVVSNSFPEKGEDLPHCVDTLKRWHKEHGVEFILYTMRDGDKLQDAINWFKEHDIPLFGVQTHPTQGNWTTSPKCHARFCIDDRNLGTPLTVDKNGNPCVDWKKMSELFDDTFKHINLITNDYTD